MVTNPLGLIAALTAFLGIWMGHVSVRKIEAQTNQLWKPMVIFLLLGHSLEIAALRITDRRLSTLCAILGFNLLWNALELKRQARRVLKGHAPANPSNPRHAAMLAIPGTQATQDDALNQVSNPGGSSAEQAEFSMGRQGS